MSEMLVRQAKETSEGDSVDVKRLFPIPGNDGYMNYDPFVLWDHFTVKPGSGFPDHPHRGFEAITYMFSGSMKHTDNLGNDSQITAGGAQRFTAGKGIIHSEMPGSEGNNQGIQLWINLPSRLKKMEPEYQEVLTENIPEDESEGVRVRTIVGETSPLKLRTMVEYAEVNIESGKTWKKIIAQGMRGFIYLVKGSLDVNGQQVKKAGAIFLDAVTDITVTANEESQFMFCTGMPHGEPIRQWGPYVD